MATRVARDLRPPPRDVRYSRSSSPTVRLSWLGADRLRVRVPPAVHNAMCETVFLRHFSSLADERDLARRVVDDAPPAPPGFTSLLRSMDQKGALTLEGDDELSLTTPSKHNTGRVTQPSRKFAREPAVRALATSPTGGLLQPPSATRMNRSAASTRTSSFAGGGMSGRVELSAPASQRTVSDGDAAAFLAAESELGEGGEHGHSRSPSSLVGTMSTFTSPQEGKPLQEDFVSSATKLLSLSRARRSLERHEKQLEDDYFTRSLARRPAAFRTAVSVPSRRSRYVSISGERVVTLNEASHALEVLHLRQSVQQRAKSPQPVAEGTDDKPALDKRPPFRVAVRSRWSPTEAPFVNWRDEWRDPDDPIRDRNRTPSPVFARGSQFSPLARVSRTSGGELAKTFTNPSVPLELGSSM